MDMLIKVRENAYKPLLDQEGVVADVNKHFRPWIDLARDLTNYGSNLIPRAFTSSQKTLADAVVLGILLRQVVAMLDGVNLLLSNGAVHTSNLQMRALFEASIYIYWILEGDSEKKAAYYYVHNLRRMRLWARRVQAGSVESREFLAIMGKASPELDDKLSEEGKTQVAEIDRVLSQPRFAPINQEFDQWRKKTGRKPSWYGPLGVSSVREIAEKVGQGSTYIGLYTGASEVMHSSSYGPHIQIGNGTLTILPIRYLKDFDLVFRFSASIAMGVFMRILKEYRAGEMPAFSRKYLEKWQKDFLNRPNIKYEVQTTRI